MIFEKHFELILSLISERDEEEEPVEGQEEAPPVDLENPEPEDVISGGSQLDELEPSEPEESPDEIRNMMTLVNILINSIRFKPSKEFTAYLHMPRFKKLDKDKQISVIQNILTKHPERILSEADEMMGAEGGMEDPMMGGMDAQPEQPDNDISYTTEFVKRLILRSITINPDVLDYSLKMLPTEVTADNYKGIIETVKTILF